MFTGNAFNVCLWAINRFQQTGLCRHYDVKLDGLHAMLTFSYIFSEYLRELTYFPQIEVC